MQRATRFFIIAIIAAAAFLVNTWTASSLAGSLSQRTANAPQTASNQAVYTGVVQDIRGNQWTVNGQVFTVSPSTIQYGALAVGSPVKVQADVAQDGLLTVISLGPADGAMPAGDNPLTKMANGIIYFAQNSGLMTTSKSPDSNEQYEVRITGTLTAMDATSITVDGIVYMLAPGSEIKDGLKIGDMVRLEYYAMPDGTVTVEELKPAKKSSDDDNENTNMNSNDNDNENDNDNYNMNSNGNTNSSYCSEDDDEDEDECCNSNSNSNSNSSGTCEDSEGDEDD